MLPSPRIFLLISALSCACAIAAAAQESVAGSGPQINIAPRPKPVEKEPVLPHANIRVNSTLVLIPVTVNDPLNRFVTGLEKENFKIYEDKVEQTITNFSSEDAPLSIGIVFDCSGSMGHKMEKARQAVSAIFQDSQSGGRSFPCPVQRRGPSGSALHQQS